MSDIAFLWADGRRTLAFDHGLPEGQNALDEEPIRLDFTTQQTLPSYRLHVRWFARVLIAYPVGFYGPFESPAWYFNHLRFEHRLLVDQIVVELMVEDPEAFRRKWQE